jgi:ribosomal protein L14E/L6E/L27E
MHHICPSAVSCIENDGFETPELNDKLYLHFSGYQRIENLTKYHNLKAIFLESNAIKAIENLDHLVDLRCLYLQQNLISRIDNLASLQNLCILDLSGNMIETIENLSQLPRLATLNMSKNALKTAESIQHLLDCKSITTLDLSDNDLPGDESNSVIKILAGMQKLCTLYLKGNALVKETKHYRKTVLTTIPALGYLDDRPIFEVERVAVDAWAAGGFEAERHARQEFERKQKESSRAQMDRFKEWQEEIRSKRLTELQQLNEDRRSRGEAELTSLPPKSFVTYGRVSDKYVNDQIKLKRLVDRAEQVAKTTGFHGTAMMDLGAEYWNTNGNMATDQEELQGSSESAAQLQLGTDHPTGPVTVETAPNGSVQYRSATGGVVSESSDTYQDEAEAKFDADHPSLSRAQLQQDAQTSSTRGSTSQPLLPSASGVTSEASSAVSASAVRPPAVVRNQDGQEEDSTDDSDSESKAKAKPSATRARTDDADKSGFDSIVAESLRLFNIRLHPRSGDDTQPARASQSSPAAQPVAGTEDGHLQHSVSRAAQGITSGGKDSTQDSVDEQRSSVWFPTLDAALKKFVVQSAFDFEKVSRGLQTGGTLHFRQLSMMAAVVARWDGICVHQQYVCGFG